MSIKFTLTIEVQKLEGASAEEEQVIEAVIEAFSEHEEVDVENDDGNEGVYAVRIAPSVGVGS